MGWEGASRSTKRRREHDDADARQRQQMSRRSFYERAISSPLLSPLPSSAIVSNAISFGSHRPNSAPASLGRGAGHRKGMAAQAHPTGTVGETMVPARFHGRLLLDHPPHRILGPFLKWPEFQKVIEIGASKDIGGKHEWQSQRVQDMAPVSRSGGRHSQGDVPRGDQVMGGGSERCVRSTEAGGRSRRHGGSGAEEFGEERGGDVRGR